MAFNDKKVLIAVLLIIIFVLGLILTFNTFIKPTSENNSHSIAGSTTPTIKVVIYNGSVVDSECVDGTKEILDAANKENLVPGYNFTYSTSPIINSAALESNDVLVMPGGEDYIDDNGKTIEGIDPVAIQNFVKNGGGYVGVCAGAFSGANNTIDCYRGWGLAPNVNCIQPYAEVVTTMQITPTGEKISGKTGQVTTLYWNGPAMSVSGNAFVIATYDGVTDSAGNVIISKGNAAIVGDYYGKGRTVLIGPHPELDPKSPIIVVNLIKWVANRQ